MLTAPQLLALPCCGLGQLPPLMGAGARPCREGRRAGVISRGCHRHGVVLRAARRGPASEGLSMAPPGRRTLPCRRDDLTLMQFGNIRRKG